MCGRALGAKVKPGAAAESDATAVPGAPVESGGPVESSAGGGGSPLCVVTVQAGDRYPDLYVNRLRGMVARQLDQPHRFVCFTDQPVQGRFDAGVEVRDLSAWGLPGFFNKLRLFDQAVTGELTGGEPFLFLDLTLVIRKSLAPLLAFGGGTPASVVGVADWNYPVLNSSVLWVRPDVHTQRVWDNWASGERYDGRIPGDQNYIDATFRRESPEALVFWPEGMVVSYKRLRKRAARDPGGAREALERAVILKFHGRPKPHEVLAPWRHLPSTVLRHPFRARLWRYLADEIEADWR